MANVDAQGRVVYGYFGFDWVRFNITYDADPEVISVELLLSGWSGAASREVSVHVGVDGYHADLVAELPSGMEPRGRPVVVHLDKATLTRWPKSEGGTTDETVASLLSKRGRHSIHVMVRERPGESGRTPSVALAVKRKGVKTHAGRQVSCGAAGCRWTNFENETDAVVEVDWP